MVSVPRTRPPYPEEFRREVVELLRGGPTPSELSQKPRCLRADAPKVFRTCFRSRADQAWAWKDGWQEHSPPAREAQCFLCLTTMPGEEARLRRCVGRGTVGADPPPVWVRSSIGGVCEGWASAMRGHH